MQNLFSQSMRSIVENLQTESKKRNLQIDAGEIACAFSKDAAVVNAAIIDTESKSDKDYLKGVDLLFLYIEISQEIKSKFPKYAISTGYYLANVSMDFKELKGTAHLVDKSNHRVASLPLSVSRQPVDAAPRAGRVSGHINWCGFGVDILIKQRIVIEVNVRWC